MKPVLIEQWRPLAGLSTHQISNYGRIRSVDRIVPIKRGDQYYTIFRKSKVLALRRGKQFPYLFTSICYVDVNTYKKFNRTVHVHRAVAEAFVRKSKKVRDYEAAGGKVYATHIIKDYENNRSDNVKWITHSELMKSGDRQKIAERAWLKRKHVYGYSGTEKGLLKQTYNQIIKKEHHAENNHG